jgi:lysozyme
MTVVDSFRKSELVDSLIDHEGLVLHQYVDSEGYATIGVGRLIDPEKGGKITKDEAIYLLHNDIDECAKSLDNSLSWWRAVPAKAQMALMHMRFQLGMTGLLKFKKTLALLKENRFKEAAIEARNSRWAKQTARRAKYVTGLIEDA